jgi:hypothetical protein
MSSPSPESSAKKRSASDSCKGEDGDIVPATPSVKKHKPSSATTDSCKDQGEDAALVELFVQRDKPSSAESGKIEESSSPFVMISRAQIRQLTQALV